MSGCKANARVDRHTLLLTTREPVRVLVGLVGQAEPLEQLPGSLRGLGLRQPQHLRGRQGEVATDAHVREQVERLEDDPDLPPDPVHVHARSRDLLAFDLDPPGVDRLQQVHAAQQGGLPGTGRPDQADHLVIRHAQVDPSEHLERPERFVEPLDPDRDADIRSHHARPPTCRRRRSRATRASTNRVMGTVTRTKTSPSATNGV